jgi:outer membrane protein OmpA-like peptidoglycan-associated protein
MTRNVTTDIGRRDRWGHGFAGLIGYHFLDAVSLEATVSAGWIPQVRRTNKRALYFISPTLELAFQPWGGRTFGPYLLAGASYESYRFANIPENADLDELGRFNGHTGLGVRYRLVHYAALRAELNADVGNGRPTLGALAGVSFFPGADAPTPATRTVTVTTPPRVDTLRLAPRVDTVRAVRVDTVQTFRTDAEVLLTLEDVNFDVAQSTLRPEAGPLLDRAAQELNSAQWAAIPVQIVGFTDSQGGDEYNLGLGLRRATTVRDYLVGRGVAATRIAVMSGGEGNPVADNSTPEGRARNRRVIIMRGLRR